MSKALLKEVLAVLKKSPEGHPGLIKRIERQLKPIKTRSAKNKGKRLQNWVCDQISRVTGIPWSNADESLIRSREMGQSGVDVVLLGEALVKFPFSIECKNTETLNLTHTINQAVLNTKEGTEWLIVYKKNGIEPICIMKAEPFFDLFEKFAK